MYNVNGAFGQVRLAYTSWLTTRETIFSVRSAGWHKCNDLYRITRPSGHLRHYVIITVGGCGEMEINGTHYSLPAGTVAVVPRGVPNSYGTPTGGMWEFYWFHPASGISELFIDRIVENGIYVGKSSDSHPYVALMEKLFKRCAECSERAAIKVSHSVSDILHFVALDIIGKTSNDSISERAMTYILGRNLREISVREIATALYISEAHLIRVFKKETGRTPHQYILECRLRAGADLLRSGQLTVKEIAREVGFYSASQFISIFRRKYGCTPVQFRDLERK